MKEEGNGGGEQDEENRMESVKGREQKSASGHGGEEDRRWIERRWQKEQRNTTAGAGGGGRGRGRRRP